MEKLTEKELITFIQLGMIGRNIYEIGKYLVKAKEILPHGTYQNWVEVTFKGLLPYPTAALYKSLYLHYKGDKLLLESTAITWLIRTKGFPKRVQKLLIKEMKSHIRSAP